MDVLKFISQNYKQTVFLLYSVALISASTFYFSFYNFHSTSKSIKPFGDDVRWAPIESAATVLVVIVSIGNPYTGIAAESVRAYCDRHNYRLHVQEDWIGEVPRGKNQRRVVLTQKLLSCTHSKGEKYVLWIDSDVVIGPWTPPIHEYAEEIGLGDNIGIVDEDQPDRSTARAVYYHRTGRIMEPSWKHYEIFGDEFEIKHGILNSGVVLVQPEKHCTWMQQLYYDKKAQTFWKDLNSHFDQPVLGVALLSTKKYKRMHHAWNRGYVYYKDSNLVGKKKYDIGDLWQHSYFLHFYWERRSMRLLENWIKSTNFSFDPKPYARHIYQ